jgi:hypothetical protein
MYSVPGVKLAGTGIVMVSSKHKAEPAATNPEKTRTDVRAQERNRKRPTAVQMPMAANAANITAPPTTNGALPAGWGGVVGANIDATADAAKTSVKMLPRIATTALAVTPTGRLIRIIYS